MGRLNIKVKNTIKEKDASTSNESKKVYKINHLVSAYFLFVIWNLV